MITKDYGKYTFVCDIYGKYTFICDICGSSADDGEFETFQDALGAREDIGWKRKRLGGEWVDVCPDCIE